MEQKSWRRSCKLRPPKNIFFIGLFLAVSDGVRVRVRVRLLLPVLVALEGEELRLGTDLVVEGGGLVQGQVLGRRRHDQKPRVEIWSKRGRWLSGTELFWLYGLPLASDGFDHLLSFLAQFTV